MSENVRFSTKIIDNEEDITESDINTVPFSSNITSKFETTHKLESYANMREVGQLKKHLARIEEIYIGLAKSWKDSEENHDHVIIYLEEQLKTAKANLADAQLTASEELADLKAQIKAFQEQMSKQQEKAALELANIRNVKEATEQSLQEAKEQIAELNANVAFHKQRTEQTANELSKRTKELGAAGQEINFLKIQLEAEKDILKTTTKNHDQVISYLKEQLREAKESMAESQAAALGGADSITEQIPESKNNEMASFSDIREEKAEEIITEVQAPVIELKAQTAVIKQTDEQEVAEIAATIAPIQEISTPKVQLEASKETVKSTFQERVNQGGTLKQSPILTAQQTREQLKMRLQGLQEVNELDKRSKEVRTPSQESNHLKVQPENNKDTSKSTIKSHSEGQVTDVKANAAANKQNAEQDISERDKLNKNLSSGSQKIDVFW